MGVSAGDTSSLEISSCRSIHIGIYTYIYVWMYTRLCRILGA